MSYQEKKAIVSIASGIILMAAYAIYALGQYRAGAIPPDDLKFWAATMLIFIGISIVVMIVIQIVFHILLSISIAIQRKMRDESCEDVEIKKSIGAEMVEDEMDRLIELKSMRIGFIIAGFGFVAALLSQVLNYSPAVLLNILFFSFFSGSLFEGVARLRYYRRGVQNG